jgi:hypothetical protein
MHGQVANLKILEKEKKNKGGTAPKFPSFLEEGM